MPKGKNDDTLELDLNPKKDRQLTNSDSDPVDLSTGEHLFDDLNPRFVRGLNEAAKAAQREDEFEDDEDLDDEDESRRKARQDDDPDEDEGEEDDEDREDAPEDEDDEDSDEPTRGRKSKWEKRLAREQRLREEDRAEIAELRRRVQERESKDALAASESEFNTFKTKTESKLDELKQKKVKAIEEGDTAAQVDLDEEITDLKVALRAKQQAHEEAKERLESAAKQRQSSPILLAKVSRWKRQHPEYMSDASFRQDVDSIDNGLAKQGLDPESDEYYKALDKKLAKLYPKYYKRKDREEARPRRHPSAQVRSEGARPMQKRVQITADGKIRMPASELARIKKNIQKFGLDPEDPANIREYVNNNRS